MSLCKTIPKPIQYSKSYISLNNPNNILEKYVFELSINTNYGEKIFKKIENGKKSEIFNENNNIMYKDINHFKLKIVKIPFNINTEHEIYGSIDHNLKSYNQKTNDIYIEFSQNSSGYALCNSAFISLDFLKLCITPPN
jgi:HD superfamily phosphodiesterase